MSITKKETCQKTPFSSIISATSLGFCYFFWFRYILPCFCKLFMGFLTRKIMASCNGFKTKNRSFHKHFLCMTLVACTLNICTRDIPRWMLRVYRADACLLAVRKWAIDALKMVQTLHIIISCLPLLDQEGAVKGLHNILLCVCRKNMSYKIKKLSTDGIWTQFCMSK